MNIQQLVKTDLNLFVILYTILDERSVSKASERLYVTQSAVSRSLSKMRELFNDPLFTRSGHQLVPTPFLEEMKPLLVTTLRNANLILQPPSFAPENWHGTLRLGVTESMELLLLPKLLKYLQEHAPGMVIETSHFAMNALEELANGDLDIALCQEYSHYPEEFVSEPFLSSRTVILTREDHPLEGTIQPLKQFQKYPKVSLRVPDWEKTHLFHSLSHNRADILDWESSHTAESLLSAVALIRATDFVLPVGDMLALEIEASGPLKFLAIEQYEDIPLNYVILTHQRIAHSPVHDWLKALLLELAKEISDERDHKMLHR